MSRSDALRHLFIGVLVIAALVVGLKLWGRQSAERRLVKELRALANPTSSFEQLYAAVAEADLYKSMGALHKGVDGLGKEPGELLQQVFRGKGGAELFPDRDPVREGVSPDPRETLIREGLLRNYQRCLNMDVFSNADNLARLARGEAPEILAEPSAGHEVVIAHLVDPVLSPGLERLIPNMIIGPPAGPGHDTPPGDFEIKQAKTLTTLLYRAQLIERGAEERIITHYDSLAQEALPKPDTASP
jgi:hypothetical protein